MNRQQTPAFLPGAARNSRAARLLLLGAATLALLLTFGLKRGFSASAPGASAGLPQARVLIVQDPLATDAFRTDAPRVHAMVDRAITNFTGKATVAAAWLSLVRTQDVVGLKVYSVPGPNSGTRPAVVEAVITGLLAAGLPPKHVIVWDKSSVDLRLAGFYDLAERYGIVVTSCLQAGYDTNSFYDRPLLGNLVWGDVEFGLKGEGLGRKSFYSKLVTQRLTKIINITPLLNHNLAGVSGNLFSLAIGSVDNSARFESDATRLATAVPEIYASTNLSDRVALNITDALICQYEGGEHGLLHYSASLNQIRMSLDPVALDVLSVQELEQLRKSAGAPSLSTNMDLYSTAALLELGVSDSRRIHVETLSSR